MAEHVGIVIKTEPGNYARIIADRKVVCGGCEPNHGGCHSCLVNATQMESRVVNPVNAKVGDLVRVHLSSGNLFTGAAILYLLPVLGLMIGAFSGPWALTGLGISESLKSIVGAVTGLVVGFVAVILLDRTTFIRKRVMPAITAIVTRESDMMEVKKDSCCD
jgi:sigma-E factor negative regulatory protein RseC